MQELSSEAINGGAVNIERWVWAEAAGYSSTQWMKVDVHFPRKQKKPTSPVN